MTANRYRIAAAALVLGLWWGMSNLYSPLVVPPISWLILAIIWFGFNGRASIFIVVMAVVPTMFICICDGISAIDRKLLEMGSFLTGLGHDQVLEYAVNGECAAGTGVFFEDQMYRLGLPLESYSEYTDRAASVPRLAGRCSVFAKTDLIHRQQEGVSAEDILLGLAYAVVRNFKTSVVRKLPVRKPVLLSGGVVKNRGVIRAVKEIFGLEEGELLCDDGGTIVSAAGLAVIAMERKVRVDWERLCEDAGKDMVSSCDGTCDGMAVFCDCSREMKRKSDGKRLPAFPYEKAKLHKTRAPKLGEAMWLGVDVGSTSTNLVLIGENQEVLDYCYIRTSGNPARAVEEGLEVLKPTIDMAGTAIVQTAVTGSGRYLIAKKLGTDQVLDEITAQARAAGNSAFRNRTDGAGG